MSSGSKKTTRNKKQQRKPHQHLPKVGTPADNAYLVKESRKDLIDFGVNHRRSSRTGIIVLVVVLLFLALGVVGLLFLSA
ncbi:MAG: hypothetical protein WCK41_12210 [Actinomycetes bacterium]